MTTVAIIVAAGRGTRAGGEVPKQWQALAGRPVLETTLLSFASHPSIDRICLVLHPDDMGRAATLCVKAELVAGASTRAGSVRNALDALAKGPAPTRVLIHDGARPLVSAGLIDRLIAALGDHPGVAPALPVTDALWRAQDGRVTGTQDRGGLFRAQTPQGFHFAPILAAHHAHPGGAADDVEVARAAGLDVTIVEGDEENLKLTFPGDFARAERILASRHAPDQRSAPERTD
jgi:2-C-methyl-D-erythritol 4-phosphate cytidylyltransferase / 2-C-methyl-D-erythritol 2,4-cyclodiphosphate synthase